MQILGLLGMYFDAVVVKVKTFLLLFRLALAILCLAATIDFDCTKMLNQDVNLRLFISLYFTEMTVLRIFFQVFIVHGMYNFSTLFVIFVCVRDRFDGATNYHNFTA